GRAVTTSLSPIETLKRIEEEISRISSR
ncbi:MAG: hypothetical protein H6Q55_1782, partial [Deltaproteobacteria bacterium]|nr:hypothetical protein [Deltaproteobacteria bacterium]